MKKNNVMKDCVNTHIHKNDKIPSFGQYINAKINSVIQNIDIDLTGLKEIQNIDLDLTGFKEMQNTICEYIKQYFDL